MRKIAGLCMLLALAATAAAQTEKGNEGHILLAHFKFAVQVPGGDLSERFGANQNISAALEWMHKSNWVLGLESSLLFGTDVKEDPLAGLRDENGLLFGDFGEPASVQLRQRGLHLGAYLGRLFPLSAANRRAGIRITLGAGILQHRIRIQEDPQVFVSLLTDDYKKGYDRLTQGLALKQFVGYQYLSKNRRINFFAGLEFEQAFTTSRRDFDFDTMQKDERSRTDLLFGLRIGWTLPFYLAENPDEIFY